MLNSVAFYVEHNDGDGVKILQYLAFSIDAIRGSVSINEFIISTVAPL